MSVYSWTMHKDIKKVCRLSLQTFNSLWCSLDYSATTESLATESVATAAESTTGAASSTVSTATESVVSSVDWALLPQDANDTAANATNKNTNFSFSLLFKSVILMLFS